MDSWLSSVFFGVKLEVDDDEIFVGLVVSFCGVGLYEKLRFLGLLRFFLGESPP